MKKNTRKLLYVFFILLMVGSLAVLAYDYFKEPEIPEIYEPTPSEIEVKDSEKVSTVIDSKVISMAPDVNLAEERAKYNNPYIVGRIEIPDLFNVLVAQSNDFKFYLDHDVSRKYDIRGTEFLDPRLTPTSKQLNIYGHNSRDPKIQVAFRKLEKLLDKTFFDNNQYIIFQHDGGKNIYKIMAIKEVKNVAGTEHMHIEYTGSDFVRHVNTLISTTGNEKVLNSRSVFFDENSEIIVLQTCSHSTNFSDPLYIVTGVRIK